MIKFNTYILLSIPARTVVVFVMDSIIIFAVIINILQLYNLSSLSFL
jgi:hypothetical protein